MNSIAETSREPRDIVLTTFNARYIHTAFGLRYLRANLGELRDASVLVEFNIQERAVDAVEEVLAYNPKVVGVSVYIWNVEVVERFVSTLKRVRPDVVVVLGGPEVSYELEEQPLRQLADHIVKGQGDVAFSDICQTVLSGGEPWPQVISGGAVDVTAIELPYGEYTDEDVAHRIMYVEASRGCPFKCEFCLSSLDKKVNAFDLAPFLAEMEILFQRGVRHFKFVDRTFNLKVNTSLEILEFFLARYEPGLFVHFEMVPDRLPEELRDIIRKYPDGSLQFEVGIQTFNPDVAKHISRRQNYEKLADNFQFLRDETGVHVHADLIIGLPGESVASFGEGFERLVELGPQEIQVGILKRLRGTPIIRHDSEFEMVYSQAPPYEILSTSEISFGEMQDMKRFARFWDLVGNSGNFRDVLKVLLGDAPFSRFRSFAEWLYAAAGRRQHGISLLRLTEFVLEYMTTELGEPADEIGPIVLADYQRPGRPKCPKFLREYQLDVPKQKDKALPSTLSRQSRHQS